MNRPRYLAFALLAACLGSLPVVEVHAAELRLHAVLNGANVVSATDSKATGEATAVLRDDGKVRINLVFGNLASVVTGAELHTGTNAENGPSAMPLEVAKNQTVGSLVNSELALSEEVAAKMRAGETYIVITTIDHPAGVIRGQLMPQPVRLGDKLEPEKAKP